ncbi:hypothetical protein NKH18_04970 [Streptomyces sp. M10(2022)]
MPDDVAGTVSQYGTVLEPDEDSRSLVNCSLTWPGHGSVRVRAVALISRMPTTVRAEDILPSGDEAGYEAPGTTGWVARGGRTWVVAECPGGLEGRVREVSGMYVTADVDLPVPGKGRRPSISRTSVPPSRSPTESPRLRNAVAPLKMPTRVIDTYEAHVTTDADGATSRSWGSTSRAWA